MTTTVERVTPSSRRNTELALLIFGLAIVLFAWVSVDLGRDGTIPPHILAIGGGLFALTLSVHLMLRWKAKYADPILLPVAMVLNGLGLVMIHRIDLASKGRQGLSGEAYKQLLWTAIAVALAVAVIWLLEDHRLLRRYTFTAMAAGFILLLLPMVPGLGSDRGMGSRIWIQVGPMSFQPGEFAKLALAVFFAGYLVNNRDVLSIAGRKILGFPFPRGRDLGPILIAFVVALGILVFQNDFGSALLFFGLFVVLLYVATERVSWIAIGMILFAAAAVGAWATTSHVQTRVALWLDPFSPESMERSGQLAVGLMGMASGGLTGKGLGQGRPWLTPVPDSDFIFASLGEELGLIGTAAILVLYLIFVERGVRTAIGVRDGFGKLLALALAFSVALQVFVVIGGVTRLIPLTGLTTPFMSLGGSSLLANWSIMALLLRISDQARRPEPASSPVALPTAAEATQVVTVR